METYYSTDVEADGPIPGPYSMLSLASVAFSADGTLHGSFSVNIAELPDASQHPDTMAFWARNPDALVACRTDVVDPGVAMHRYAAWVRSMPGKPVFVAYPAGFDFTFVYWYLIRFTGSSPFGFSALDIKSYAAAMLGKTYRGVSKRTMPKEWRSQRKHTHIAIDDAIEQYELFRNMLAANARRTPPTAH